jgi:hypothetical protein
MWRNLEHVTGKEHVLPTLITGLDGRGSVLLITGVNAGMCFK